MAHTKLRSERGAALIETAVTIPIVLLICVGIFEFGRAYQTWQVLTNAAREGARVAVIAGVSDGDVQSRVKNYLSMGQLQGAASANVQVERNVPMGAGTASRVTVSFPFSFIVLNPVVRLVTPNSNTGSGALTMQSVAIMRNEG